jgi:hypothetical protein
MGSCTPGPIAFPMVGVGFGQTFQLNAFAFNPCLMQLAIYDSNGILLASRSASPPTDKYGMVRVRFPFHSPNRTELRAEVTAQPTTTSPCEAQATVEVYDDFDKSTWVLTPGLHPPSPCIQSCSATTIGPAGLGLLQAVRMNVVAHPPNPCMGTLSFVDVRGNPIGPSSPVSVSAGHAAFLDLPGQMVASSDGHGEVIAIFTPSPAATPGTCIASVEVFDQITGHTRALIKPGVGHE